MLRTDCIACSRPNLISIKSTKNHNYHTVCHARLPRRKAPWLQRLGSTMLSFNWRGKPQENTIEQPSNHLVGGGASDNKSVEPSISSPSPTSSHQVENLFENQRWIGTWQPPVAILDIPSWTDADGNEVALTHLTAATNIDPSTSSYTSTVPPTSISTLITASSDWEVVITPSTDIEGWQYATVFKHLEYKRPGGRASQRFGDTCRRRAWRKRSGIGLRVSDGISAVSLNTAATDTSNERGGSESSRNAATAAAAAKARETEAKNKAIRGFITMVLDLLSRRKVWTLVPWDPSALFFLYKKHQEIYQQLQTQASQRQIFAADTPPPPSMLHPQSGSNIEHVGTATLLQDLLCAAMHSRAAYGFAMAAGHITSVTSYIKLQTVQPLTFNAVAGASIEANNEAVAALAGIASEDILLSEWKNFPFRPCHYVAIDRVNRCVVISIRGTLEIGDLLSDLAAHPMEIELGGVDGWVHPGILSAASYIHCTTEAALKDAETKCPGWPVLITGHSLGGGVAALLCMLLRDRGGAAPGLGPVFAITVGSAAVMSESLAAACEEYVISLVLGSDVIPHLSYASVERLLVEASEASPVRRVAEGLKKKLDSVLNITTSGISGGSNAVSEAAVNAMNSSGSGLAQLLNLENADTRGEAETPNAPFVPIIDLSNTNSNPTQDTSTTNAAVPPNATGVVPVVKEEEISILNYSSFGSDTGLAAAAMAQQQQRKEQIKQEQQLPNDPELLFPPGRILWIFPADEDVTSLAENSTITNDGTGMTGGEDVCIYDEEKMEQSWDNAWEQGRFTPTTTSGGEGNGGGRAAVGVEEGNEKEIKQSGRGVNIYEAEAQVVASHAQQHHQKQEEGVKEGGEQTASLNKKPPPPSSVPVIVEAERSAFERLLLMPDSLNDHLPHRILEALQQL